MITTTIAELIAAAEAERLAAERAASDAQTAITRLLRTAEADGIDKLYGDQAAEADRLMGDRRRAQDAVTAAKGKLAGLRAVAADEDRLTAAAAVSAPTSVAGWRSGDRDHDLGSGRAALAASGGPRWVRSIDGRPGVVERAERFAEHPVNRDAIARTAERDRHIVGMHGGLGSLVRAMSTTSGSAVVPSIWAADVIDRARNLAAVIQAGATLVPMDAKIVQIGRLTADPSSGFRAEGSTITASDPTFDNVTLTATTLSALVIGSLEWFQDVSPGGGADQLVTEALAKVLALQIDLAALFGGITTGVEQAGVGNNLLPSGGLPNPPNPRGVLATLLAVASSSVLGSATNGTPQTAATFYKEVLDTIYTVRDFNEAPSALLWPSHLARVYAEAADTTNQPMRPPPDVAALPQFITNQIPSGMTQGTGLKMADLFVGNFAELLIGQRLELTIQTLTERYAELGQIGILATWRGDVQLARPRAFAAYRYLAGA